MGIEARLDRLDAKLDRLEQIELKIEKLEKQQDVLNGDLRSLMNDILTEIKESRKTTQEQTQAINVLSAKVDALTDKVSRNEFDLHFLEENYHKTASDLAYLKRIK